MRKNRYTEIQHNFTLNNYHKLMLNWDRKQLEKFERTFTTAYNTGREMVPVQI